MLLKALATSTATIPHLTTLLNYLVSTYFVQLNTVLIVHNSSHRSTLQQQYLNDVQLAFSNQSAAGSLTGLLWIDVAGFCQDDFEQAMLQAVDIVIEGFITILPDTVLFLHARYYATRYAKLRLKDKFYLFLSEEQENPEDLLATEILQFYPHHLMVRPWLKQTENEITTLNKFSANDKAKGLGPEARATRVLEPTGKATSSSSSSSQLRDINFELWTQKFVGAVGNLDAILLDAFLPNETFTHNVELYPNKLSNLKGRTLKVGSVTYMPYVVTNYVDAGVGNVDPIDSNDANLSVVFVGSEAKLVTTFCEIRNCHLRVEPYGDDNWGSIFDNGTSTGVLGGVYEQRVEFAIGCIYNWYNEITETSSTIARSAVTILGPAPGLTPPWYTNVAPFSIELWMFVLTTMLISSGVLYLINLSSRNPYGKSKKQKKIPHVSLFEESCLNIFAVFLQQPSAPIGLNNFAGRIFLITQLVATITLENTYSGQLKSLLTVPLYSNPVDTVEKWSETDWKWATPSDAWIGTIQQTTLEKEKVLADNFEVLDHAHLYNNSFRSDYGMGIERLMSGTFNFGKYITTEIMDDKIILKDDLYFDLTRAATIRGWPLMPVFNKHVRACIESGLYLHWEISGVVHMLDRQIEVQMMNSARGRKSKDPPKKLDVENIAGAIFILLIGLILSAIVFFLEVFEHSLKKTFSNIQQKYLRELS